MLTLPARFLAAVVAALATAGCTGTGSEEVTTPQIRALGDAHHGERFDPPDRTVAVGETVVFHVVGATPHTVDFEQDDGVSAPHSGNLDEGDTHTVRFDKPGTYRYYCQYHIPGMRGTIVVS